MREIFKPLQWPDPDLRVMNRHLPPRCHVCGRPLRPVIAVETGEARGWRCRQAIQVADGDWQHR